MHKGQDQVNMVEVYMHITFLNVIGKYYCKIMLQEST